MGLRNLFGRREPVEAAPQTAEPETEREPGLRIVIVDDDPDARDFIRMGLEFGGFEIVGEGGDGPSAVAAVREGKPDLVLLDLHMPDIGGIELLPALREAHRPAKFVVMAGPHRDRSIRTTSQSRLCAR